MNTEYVDRKIAVGMSGGTDSSAAASMLVDQGAQVVGLTAHMWKEGSRCCSLLDVERARKVAWHLGIRHFVLNAQEAFSREVVDPFIEEYIRGRTPSPCVLCNKMIKFGFLLNRTVQFDCDAIATGHYARIDEQNGRYRLLKAKDSTKDQSYFLHRLSQRQLSHIRFPLGELMKKEDVLPYVEKRKLPVSESGESQDLCFVLDGNHAAFVETHAGHPIQPGRIIDTGGKQLGAHQGIHKYTVGQRRGIGIASTQPLYVVSIDSINSDVILGTRDEACSSQCRLENVHWISETPPSPGTICKIKIRYQHDEVPAVISLEDNGSTVAVSFEEPQFAVSPGQAGVIYSDDEVLGGGWIKS